MHSVKGRILGMRSVKGRILGMHSVKGRILILHSVKKWIFIVHSVKGRVSSLQNCLYHSILGVAEIVFGIFNIFNNIFVNFSL
jgi:hypothetical protein